MQQVVRPIRRLWVWFRARWGSPPQEVPAPEVGVKPEAPVEEVRGSVAPASDAAAVDIRWVLDRLPKTMKALRRLRKTDPAAHKLLSRLGAPLFDLNCPAFSEYALDPTFLAQRPMFRAAFFGDEDDFSGRNVPAAGAYLYRVDRPGAVQQRPGATVYRLGLLHVSGHDSRNFHAYVGIYPSGEVEALPEVYTNIQIVRHRVKRRRPLKGGDNSYVRQTITKVPDWIGETARTHNWSPQDWLEYVVRLVSWARLPEDHILVRASNLRETVAFAIAKTDGKRFFRFRESDLAADGKRKRILHYVEGHTRMTARGEQYVRPHYRGDRHFSWHGYDVKISGLGFHHGNVFEAPLGVVEGGSNDPMLLTPGEVAERVSAEYDAPRMLRA